MQWKNTVLSFVCSIVIAAPAMGASLVTYSGTPTTLSGIKVYPQATVKTPAGDIALVLSGSGIGRKTKIFTFDAYVAASYVVDVTKLRAAATPLDGIKAQSVKVLSITMLWNLSKEEIKSAFREGLIRNNVDLNETAIVNVFSQFETGMNKTQSATLVSYPESGSLETLVLELPAKSIQEKGKDLATEFWSIWFGKGDKNIMTLQPKLVGKGN